MFDGVKLNEAFRSLSNKNYEATLVRRQPVRLMNDYTKNISSSIFSPGLQPSPSEVAAAAVSAPESVISKGSLSTRSIRRSSRPVTAAPSISSKVSLTESYVKRYFGKAKGSQQASVSREKS